MGRSSYLGEPSEDQAGTPGTRIVLAEYALLTAGVIASVTGLVYLLGG